VLVFSGLCGLDTRSLTASATTGNLDTIDGTSGNDTFNALADGFLETGDALNGGGGIDTVNARFTANDQTFDPTLSGIEKAFLQVDSGAGNSFTFDGADVTSQLFLKNTATPTAPADLNTFSNVALTTTVGIEKGADTTDLTVAFAGATGTADTASLALNAALADTVTLAGVETLNVVGAAGTSTIGTVAAVNAATVNVSGAGVVNLTATDFAATVAVDASTSTGGVSVAAEAGSTLTFTGSAVADTVNMGATLTSADKLDGGDGSDVLSVSTATSTINAAGVKGFEAINVSGSASITHDIAAFAANNTISNVILNSALAGNNLVTVSNLTSGGTLTLGGATALTATDDATVNIKDAGVAGSNSDVANIAIVGTAAVDFGDITIGDTETINIASGGVTTGNSIDLLAVDKAASLVVTGDSELTITAFTGSAVLTSIDASATTGGFIMVAAGASTSATLIKGGSGADTLIGNSGADIITGGAGADTLTGNAGADKFVIASTDSGVTTATADIIADFAKAADTLSLGTAGTAANFFELSASTTVNDDIGTVELALTAANAATGAGTSFDGTVQYMFVVDANGGNNGYLVADNDLNGVADFAVELTGLAATGDVVFGDIVA
jgi:Ca2+-binding RTX toxin-like protein